jgi:hypothetical protein
VFNQIQHGGGYCILLIAQIYEGTNMQPKIMFRYLLDVKYNGYFNTNLLRSPILFIMSFTIITKDIKSHLIPKSDLMMVISYPSGKGGVMLLIAGFL